MPNIETHELLTAALAGYQHQLESIQARIPETRSALGVKGPAKPKRKISAAGRARIRSGPTGEVGGV